DRARSLPKRSRSGHKGSFRQRREARNGGGFRRGNRAWEASLSPGERRCKKVLKEELMEAVLRRENLRVAWLQVKANDGAPGVDGLSGSETKQHIEQQWE